MRRLLASLTLAAVAAVPGAAAAGSGEPCTPGSLTIGACLDLFCEDICAPEILTTWCENPKLCPGR